MALNVAQLMNVPGGPGIVGAIKAGTGINVLSDGTLNLQPPTSAVIGGVKAGQGIIISSDGSISATAQGVTSITSGTPGYSFNPATGAVTFTTAGGVIADFDPVVLIGGGSWQYSGGGAGQGPVGTVQIPIPPGADRCALWSRCRFLIFAPNDGTVVAGQPPAVAWGENVAYKMEVTAGPGAFLATDARGVAPEMSCAVRASRGNTTVFTRYDLMQLTGTGERTVTVSITGSCGDSGRDGNSLVAVDLFQVIVLPYINGYA